jgi:hypothetical protein
MAKEKPRDLAPRARFLWRVRSGPHQAYRSGAAGQGFSCFDPGEPLTRITEGGRRSDLQHLAAELSRETAQHDGFAWHADAPDSGRDGLE